MAIMRSTSTAWIWISWTELPLAIPPGRRIFKSPSLPWIRRKTTIIPSSIRKSRAAIRTATILLTTGTPGRQQPTVNNMKPMRWNGSITMALFQRTNKFIITFLTQQRRERSIKITLQSWRGCRLRMTENMLLCWFPGL